MAEVNNLPEAEDTKTKVTAKVSGDMPGKKAPAIDLGSTEDTKTKVTAKISGDTPGKKAPAIDLQTPAPEANAPAEAPKAAPANTMTGRTMKLQGLAGLANPQPAVAPAPSAAPAAPEPAPAADDTRTRRTVKLASLASAPAIKPLDLTTSNPAKKAPTVVAAPDQANSASTVTRRTQKLEALDTQEVAAIEEAVDTATKKATKIDAVAAAPAPQTLNKAAGAVRHTIKVEGSAPGNIPSAAATANPQTVQIQAPAPAAAIVDPAAKDNGPKTIQVAGVAPATVSAVELNAVKKDDPKTIQISAPAAVPAEDTTTRKAAVVTAPAEAPAAEKFKAANVDDTVKLQRPAPRPAMPGSVAPAAQAGAPAVGGIKLNKPKPVPKPEPKPEPKVEEEKPAEEKPAENAAEKPAEPTGNLGKDQTPPKKKKGLKVNTDAIKDLGSSPAAATAGGAAPTIIGGALPPKAPQESTGINVTFAVFAIFALILLVFVALVATGDYFKIWQGQTADPGKALISLFK